MDSLAALEFAAKQWRKRIPLTGLAATLSPSVGERAAVRDVLYPRFQTYFLRTVPAIVVGRSRVRVCELCFGPGFCADGALLGDGPDFHHRAIRQTRTLFGDGHRLVEALRLQQEVTANGFLGFRKRAIGHHPPILA